MSHYAVEAEPDPAAPTAGDRVRFVLRGIGQTLITLGLVVLLFVVYEVYISNFFAHQRQVKVHNALENAWANGRDPLLGLPGSASVTIPLGVGIANLYIPRLGKDYAWTIVQGTSDADLNEGPGHYVETQLPGQTGNFAIAGHRVGKGEPFLNLDKLRPGDAVIVETKSTWYVYRVKGSIGDNDLGSTAGKTTNSSSAHTAMMSSAACVVLSARPPGRLRQIQVYIRPSPCCRAPR